MPVQSVFRILLDVSLISLYISTPREQKGATFLVCESAISTSRFAQKYYCDQKPLRAHTEQSALVFEITVHAAGAYHRARQHSSRR